MKIRTNKIHTEKPEHAFTERDYSSCATEGYALLLIMLILLLSGLAILYSTSFANFGTGLFTKQLIWTGAGVCSFAAVVLLGYKTLCNISPVFYILLLLFLLLPVTVMRTAVNGAYRWISIGPIRIQPSEFAKLILILFWANFLSRHFRDIELVSFKKVFLPMLATLIPVIALVYLGKDLGTTVLICAIFFIMIFASGMPLWYTLFPAGLGAAGILAIFNPAVRDFFLKIGLLPEYRIARIVSFQSPELFESGSGYQLWFSQLALGSGEWLGMGLTNSRLKLRYLPEAHTDFILSIMGEELGFVSLILVMVLYLLLVIVGMTIAYHSRTRQGALMAFGISGFIGLQAFINIGVICGALPTKGMPAPFISYGGSSLLTCMTAIGLVFSVALDNSYPDYAVQLKQRIRKFFGHKQ